MFSRTLLAKAMSAAMIFSMTGTAYADGFSAKELSFVPSQGLLDTRFSSIQGVVVPRTVDTQAIVAATIRRNSRIAVRKNAMAKAAQPVKPVVNVDENAMTHRERLVYRGNKRMPTKCANLHTHERAICLTQHQTAKMVRLQAVATR